MALAHIKGKATVDVFILGFRGSVVAGPEVHVAAVQPVIDPGPVRLLGDGGDIAWPGQPGLGVGDGVQDLGEGRSPRRIERR